MPKKNKNGNLLLKINPYYVVVNRSYIYKTHRSQDHITVWAFKVRTISLTVLILLIYKKWHVHQMIYIDLIRVLRSNQSWIIIKNNFLTWNLESKYILFSFRPRDWCLTTISLWITQTYNTGRETAFEDFIVYFYEASSHEDLDTTVWLIHHNISWTSQ